MAPDPYRYFRIEARELIDQLASGALELEKGARTKDAVAGLLRRAHTLKGAARVVKQVAIADRAHALEEVLAPERSATGPVTRDRIDRVLALLDEMDALLAQIAAPAATAAPGAPPGAGPATGPALGALDDAIRTVRTEIGDIDALSEAVSEAHAQLGPLRAGMAGLDRARHLVDLLGQHLAAPRRGDVAADDIAAARLRAIVDELRHTADVANRNIAGGVGQIDRELRSVRDDVERLRLVPAATLFHSLERAARDAAQAQGKQVQFEGMGGELRLDAHVVATVQPALVQAVRNAVAHGIEPASARIAAGKPPDGRVLVKVARLDKRVAFACNDDGRGVDLEAVRRAVAGDRPPAAERSTEDLLAALLAGGISTSTTVTEMSGRGIGLDVVREIAADLGGEVHLRTSPGAGTTLELLVPLSLTSLDALVVEASGAASVIPIESVRRAMRLAEADLSRTDAGETVMCDGEVMPFLPLARAMSGRATPTRAGAWSAVIVEGRGGAAAIGVDRLLGTVNVVLRSLPALAAATAVVAGASFDAAGNPQLVLDADGLVAEARRAGAVPTAKTHERPSILVIDDSLTTRRLEQTILESAGYQVELASSAEEGLVMAQTRRFAVFLVDVEMPGMDGFTFVARTRADPALCETPCVLVTSRDSADDRQRGREVGASAHIVKGEFHQGEFLDTIRRLVG